MKKMKKAAKETIPGRVAFPAFVRGNWVTAVVEAFSSYLGFNIDRK